MWPLDWYPEDSPVLGPLWAVAAGPTSCGRLRRVEPGTSAANIKNPRTFAEIVGGILEVTPLTKTVPEEARTLIRQAYALLQHAKITDLLLEVDRWTGFAEDFTKLKNSQPAKNRTLLLTVILARRD